jgi:hypothetical protein
MVLFADSESAMSKLLAAAVTLERKLRQSISQWPVAVIVLSFLFTLLWMGALIWCLMYLMTVLI